MKLNPLIGQAKIALTIPDCFWASKTMAVFAVDVDWVVFDLDSKLGTVVVCGFD